MYGTQYVRYCYVAVTTNNDVWTKHIYNAVHNTSLQHPLQNPITIIQIFHEALHCTTPIAENTKYCHYDSLRLPIPSPVNKMHTRLITWYAQSPLPDSLAPEFPYITTPYTQYQQDGWSCALHMLLVSLSAIYQCKISSIPYSQRNAYQLSRMHLRDVITGELTPWIDKLITYRRDPHKMEDSESHSKPYSAGAQNWRDKI